MKKYSKNKLKKKRGLKFLIVLLVILFIVGIALLSFVLLNKKVVYGKVDNSAKNVSDDIASNSYPVLINNLVIGGVYNNTWVSKDRYYNKSKNKASTEINVYTNEGKAGTYVIKTVNNNPSNNSYNVSIDSTNLIDEYLAVRKSDNNIMQTTAYRNINVSQADIDAVKDALSYRKLFNSSVKINSKHEVRLSDSVNGTIICATNESKKSNGVYSAVVYVDERGNASCVKYSYIKDLDDASDWPIYSFKFVGDINEDGTSEIVIQETKEFEVIYDILGYRNGKFVEVLSASTKIK